MKKNILFILCIINSVFLHGMEAKGLFEAIYNNDSSSIDAYLKSGLTIDLIDPKRGQTPLHAALYKPKIFTQIIEHPQIKTIINKPDSNAHAPLHYAIMAQEEEVIKSLIKHGADLHYVGRFGNTALRDAIYCYPESPSLVRMLIRYGAQVNMKNKQQETALFLASALGRSMCQTVLLEHGADPNISDTLGLTPLHLAASSSEPSAVDTLLAHSANPLHKDQYGRTAFDYANRPHISPTRLINGRNNYFFREIKKCWESVRQLWIGHLKNKPSECLFAHIPAELVCSIANYLYAEAHTIGYYKWKKELKTIKNNN